MHTVDISSTNSYLVCMINCFTGAQYRFNFLKPCLKLHNPIDISITTMTVRWKRQKWRYVVCMIICFTGAQWATNDKSFMS